MQRIRYVVCGMQYAVCAYGMRLCGIPDIGTVMNK